MNNFYSALKPTPPVGGRRYWIASMVMLVMLLFVGKGKVLAYDLYLFTNSENSINGINPDNWSGTKIPFTSQGNDIYTLDIKSWTIKSSDNGELRFRIKRSDWSYAYVPSELKTELTVGANSLDVTNTTQSSGKGDNYWYFTPTSGHTYRLTVNAKQNESIYATVKLEDTTSGQDTPSGDGTKSKSLIEAGSGSSITSLSIGSDYPTIGWDSNVKSMTGSASNNIWSYTISNVEQNRNVYFRFFNGANGLVADGGNVAIGICDGKTVPTLGSISAQKAVTANASSNTSCWYFNTGTKYKTFYIEAIHASDGNWYTTVTGADDRSNYEISTDGGKTWTVVTSNPMEVSSSFASLQVRKGADGKYTYFVPTITDNTTFTNGTDIAGSFNDINESEATSFSKGSMTSSAGVFRLTIAEDKLTLQPLYSHTIYVHDYGDASTEVSDATYIKTDGEAVKLRGNSDIITINGISWYRYTVNTVNEKQLIQMGESTTSLSGTDTYSESTPTYWCYEKSGDSKTIVPSTITTYQWCKDGSVVWNTLKEGDNDNWTDAMRPFYVRKVSLSNHEFAITYYYKSPDASASSSVTLPNGTAYTIAALGSITTNTANNTIPTDATKFTFTDEVNGETFGYTLAFSSSSTPSLTLTSKTDGTALFILAGKNITDNSNVKINSKTYNISSLDKVVDANGAVWYKVVDATASSLTAQFMEGSTNVGNSVTTTNKGVSYWYYDGTQVVPAGTNFSVYQYKAADDATWTTIKSGQTVYNGYFPMRLRILTKSDNTEKDGIKIIIASDAKSDYTREFTKDNLSAAYSTTDLDISKTNYEETEKTNTKFTTDINSDKGFTLTIDNNNVSLTAIDRIHYFFVSPELTNSQRLEYFRLKPQRTRSGNGVNSTQQSGETVGELSSMYYVFNLKTPDIKDMLDKTTDYKNTSSIHFWIEDDNGNKYTSGKTSSYNLFSTTKDENLATYRGKKNTVVLNDDGQTKWENRGYGLTTRSSSETVSGNDMFEVSLTDGVSFSWFFDSTNKRLEQATNTASIAEVKSGSEYTYYVIGNFNAQVKGGNWNPGDDNGRRFMKRYIYYKGKTSGVEDNSTEVTKDMITWLNPESKTATVDSVVYKATINRPKIGWSNLYLAFASGDQVTSYSNAENANNNDFWNALIRPEGQWYGTSGNGTAMGMDVSSLRGGLFMSASESDNRSQALDPVVDAYRNASSYTVSMNMTTSTYRIDFDTKTLYIVGNAVRGSKEGSIWHNNDSRLKEFTVTYDDNTTSKWHALPLQYVDEDDAYEYRDEQGNEQPVYLLGSGKYERYFRFSHLDTNGDTPTLIDAWYGEDSNAPEAMTGVTTSIEPVGGDTPFINYLSLYDAEANGNSNLDFQKTIDGEGKNTNKNIEFRMASNRYYIRFHIDKNGDKPVYYYEIIPIYYMNDFTEDDPLGVRAAIFSGNRYFRMFSDQYAHILPEGVDMYVVNKVNFDENTITVQKVKSDFIPAETGVLLATKDVTSSTYLKTYKEVYDEDNSGIILQLPLYTKNINAKLNNITNLLVPAYGYTYVPESVEVEKDGSANKKYNYVFWYSSVYGAAFYIPVDNYYTSSNSCYLQLDQSTRGIGDPKYDGEITGSSTAKKFAFGFIPMWQNEDDPTTTGINSITNGRSFGDSSYYTLGGIRVSKPLSKGIYIHNGKKVIVR